MDKNVKEILALAKDEIKERSTYEESLKSISFTINEEKKSLIVYFAWNKDKYDDFYKERDIFRKLIISMLKTFHLFLNRSKSTPAKYYFYYKDEIK